MSRCDCNARCPAHFSKVAPRCLPLGNPMITALPLFAHDGSARSAKLPESRFRRPRRLWQFAIIWGISVRLSALAVLTVLSTAAASANDRYHPHLHSLNPSLAGRIPVAGVKLTRSGQFIFLERF